MKCGARIALGVAGGYFLGRTKKMKLALMLGGMAAGRQTGGPAQLLQQGAKLLGQSPELGRLTDEIRGRLLEAGKGAAVAVATRQVEALTDRLVSQVGTATEAGCRTVSDASERTGQAARTVSGLGRRRPRQEADSDGHDEEASDRYEDEPAEDRVGEEPEAEEEAPEVEDEAAEDEQHEDDEQDEDEQDEDEQDEDEQDEDEQDEDEQDEDEQDEDEQDEVEEEPPPSPRRSARTGVGGRRATDATGRAAGSARPARQTAGERAGRPVRGRQGRSNG